MPDDRTVNLPSLPRDIELALLKGVKQPPGGVASFFRLFADEVFDRSSTEKTLAIKLVFFYWRILVPNQKETVVDLEEWVRVILKDQEAAERVIALYRKLREVVDSHE